jgi:uncharacterized RDD family membrane protein YckC
MSDSSYEILCSNCRAPMPSTAEVCPACGHVLGRGVVPPLVTDRPSASSLPAATPTVRVVPGLRADGSRAYGGFGVRLGAAVVDSIVVGVPVYLLQRSLGLYALLVGFPLGFYGPVMESSRAQATVGKIALGLVVTDTSYRRISFWRALGRHLAKFVSALVLYLGYVMVVFTPQKRALHDYIAGTVVLRT